MSITRNSKLRKRILASQKGDVDLITVNKWFQDFKDDANVVLKILELSSPSNIALSSPILLKDVEFIKNCLSKFPKFQRDILLVSHDSIKSSREIANHLIKIKAPDCYFNLDKLLRDDSELFCRFLDVSDSAWIIRRNLKAGTFLNEDEIAEKVRQKNIGVYVEAVLDKTFTDKTAKKIDNKKEIFDFDKEHIVEHFKWYVKDLNGENFTQEEVDYYEPIFDYMIKRMSVQDVDDMLVEFKDLDFVPECLQKAKVDMIRHQNDKSRAKNRKIVKLV